MHIFARLCFCILWCIISNWTRNQINEQVSLCSKESRIFIGICQDEIKLFAFCYSCFTFSNWMFFSLRKDSVTYSPNKYWISVWNMKKTRVISNESRKNRSYMRMNGLLNEQFCWKNVFETGLRSRNHFISYISGEFIDLLLLIG